MPDIGVLVLTGAASGAGSAIGSWFVAKSLLSRLEKKKVVKKPVMEPRVVFVRYADIARLRKLGEARVGDVMIRHVEEEPDDF